MRIFSSQLFLDRSSGHVVLPVWRVPLIARAWRVVPEEQVGAMGAFMQLWSLIGLCSTVALALLASTFVSGALRTSVAIAGAVLAVSSVEGAIVRRRTREFRQICVETAFLEPVPE
jgi:hypothetical protein